MMTTFTDLCDEQGCAYDEECVCTRCGGQASCDDCGTDAVPQDKFEGFLCGGHLEMAWESYYAELRHDQDREA